MNKMISIRSGNATRLSKQQAKALSMIDEIERELSKHNGTLENTGGRWFIQDELQGITLHTMKALAEKGYLKQIEILGCPYYRIV